MSAQEGTEHRIRAVQTQLFLRTAWQLPPMEWAAVRTMVGPAALEEIDRVAPLGWHSMSLHMRLSDAVRDVIGPERAILAWRETMMGTFQRPLLTGFVQMGRAVFGVTPASLLRQGHRIYTQITHNLGSLRYEPDATGSGGEAILRGFPASSYRFICWVEGLQGCIEACFPLANARGEVTVVESDEARGDVRYRMRWTPGSA